MEKTLAFLLMEGVPNGYVLLSGFYEDIKDTLPENFEEVVQTESPIQWSANIANAPHKIFKISKIKKEKKKPNE